MKDIVSRVCIVSIGRGTFKVEIFVVSVKQPRQYSSMSRGECEISSYRLGLINNKEYTDRFFFGCKCYTPTKIRVHYVIGFRNWGRFKEEGMTRGIQVELDGEISCVVCSKESSP